VSAALEMMLSLISAADHANDYAARYRFILHAMHLAERRGFETGVRIDPEEPEWPVVYIELPTGQVSWHMPQHARPWDGHTTEQKYSRIQDFLDRTPQE